MMYKVKLLLSLFLRKRGKSSFLNSLSKSAIVLDVGCGNDSPLKTKLQRPDIFYVGLDVENYNQKIDPNICADRYIITSKESFIEEINKFYYFFDAIISSHNLEHCELQKEVLGAMLKTLKSNGRIFLAFPCKESVSFPKRMGTLNFYDDPTHKNVPDFDEIMNELISQGFRIDFSAKRYRSLILALLGFIFNPIAFLLKRNMPLGLTWNLYGFESIIWASRSE